MHTAGHACERSARHPSTRAAMPAHPVIARQVRLQRQEHGHRVCWDDAKRGQRRKARVALVRPAQLCRAQAERIERQVTLGVGVLVAAQACCQQRLRLLQLPQRRRRHRSCWRSGCCCCCCARLWSAETGCGCFPSSMGCLGVAGRARRCVLGVGGGCRWARCCVLRRARRALLVFALRNARDAFALCAASAQPGAS